jgi:uncharacterized protein YyaL (SSP411 family)
MTDVSENTTLSDNVLFFTAPPPGATAYETSLINAFRQIKAARGKSYQPRTRHLRADGWAEYTNRLFLESSPYLLQHAHNPVNWYPWGDEAFETAKRLNRPVFLSVGYSTCHWCHVMEEESFEDEEIARYLNANYIAVKVDREERPDIDAIYMSAVQALTGHGGWPLSAWLTPDRKPFYGGTYFPARDGDRGAAIGFLTILQKLNESFHQQDGPVEKASAQLTVAISQMMAPKAGSRLPQESVLQNAISFYRQRYDERLGGIQGAPKFPSSLPVRFLLRYFKQYGHGQDLEMARNTLNKMAGGGMYDHVAGGFHRYSTDARWLVPHFEKMLYDNALLAIDYLEAWQATGDESFKRVAHDILRYVQRDMTAPEGAFYSATDADSLTPEGHREEGYFFTWTPEELENILGKDRANIAARFYRVSGPPNFEGRYILHTPESISDIAGSLKMSEPELQAIIDESRDMMYQARKNRPEPLRDEKILTAWNALMISAFARAGLVFEQPEYLEQAVKAARFILDRLYISNRLMRSYKDGQARHGGYLEDYAFLIAAWMDLYEATHDLAWLEKAIALDKILEKEFEDPGHGGYFMTGTDHEELIAKEKPYADTAVPSGNSVQALNLLRLHAFTTDDKYRRRAEKTLTAFSSILSSAPAAMSEMLLALDFYLDTPLEIIIVTPTGRDNAARPFLQALGTRFIPNRILAVVNDGDLAAVSRLIPLAGEKTPLNGKATAYVCRQGTCALPADDPEAFIRQIEKNRAS